MAGDDDVRRELERVQRRTKQLKDSSSLALVELDMEGKIAGWNRQAEVVFGWPEAEVLGRHFEVIVPPAARGHVDAIFRALTSGEVKHSRNLNLHRDGRLITCQWYNAVLRDESGAVYLVYCEVRDVSAEEELRQRQQLMQAIADRSPLGISAKGPDGRYVYANHQYARILGRPPEAVLGHDDLALFPPDVAQVLRHHDVQVSAGDRPLTREDSAGEQTYTTLSFPVRDGAGQLVAVCSIVHDITEIRRAERERAALQQQVIESQRLALAELSTPLIPVAEGVLVMPLIGTIDSTRAEMIMSALLAGVAEQRAHAVILDITGVRTIDTQIADALLRSARAVRLLGAEAILTGVGPGVAQTLVELGVELRDLVTHGSLRGGVAYALQRGRRAKA